MRGDLGGAERVQGVDERRAPKTAEDVQERHSAKGQRIKGGSVRRSPLAACTQEHARRNTHARARMQAHTRARAHKHAVAALALISYLSVRKSRRRRPPQHDRAVAEAAHAHRTDRR